MVPPVHLHFRDRGALASLPPADRVERIVADAPRRRSMGEAARSRFLEDFDLARAAPRHADRLESITEREGVTGR
jgi:hypothetical protein